MLPRLCFAALVALVLSSAVGCARRTASPVPAPDAGPRTTPIEPTAPLEAAQLDFAKVQLDLAQCRGAIRAYQQINDGKSPSSLAELGVRLSFPHDLSYDATTGKVKSKTYPAL